MDDSKTVPDKQSEAAADETVAASTEEAATTAEESAVASAEEAAADEPVAEASAPTPPRPRGKHRLPPRRAMSASAAQADLSATETVSTPDVAAIEPSADGDAAESAEPTQPTESPEVSPDEPAEVAPTEPAPTEVGTASPARRWKWFRRRSAEAAAAGGGDAVSDAATEPVQEETPTAEEPPTEEGKADAADEESTAEVADETPLSERKPVTKRLTIAVAAAAAVFVAAAAFAGAMLQPYLADRALVDTKLNVARTAANAITTLWTYTPDDMDRLPDRSAKYLSGDFQDQYRKYVDAIAPTNKQARVSNGTEVMGAAVEALDGPNATAVVYTNSTYSSPVTKNIPSLRYLSYRLTMRRADTRWLITKMTTITSVDLTPKLG